MERTSYPQTVLLPIYEDKDKGLEVFRTIQHMGLKFHDYDLNLEGDPERKGIKKYLALTCEVPRNQLKNFQVLFGDCLDKESRKVTIDSVCD